MRTVLAFSVTLGLALGPGVELSAQSAELGPRVGYDLDAESASLGGQLRLGTSGGFVLLPSADYFLDSEMWQINFDGAVALGQGGPLYAGFGVGILSAGGGSGLNILLGLGSARRRAGARPYAELRWTVREGSDPLRLVIGLNFGV